MRRRCSLVVLFAAVVAQAADASLEGKWIWNRIDSARSTLFREFPAQTEFEFHKSGKAYSGHIRGTYPAVDADLQNIEWDGKNLSFVTGKPGGGGSELLTKWSGTLSADTIKGTYTYTESRSYGNFEMSRVK